MWYTHKIRKLFHNAKMFFGCKEENSFFSSRVIYFNMWSLIGEATAVQHSCKFLYTNALLNQVKFLLHPPQLASCASLLFAAERPENRGLTGVFQ